MTATAFRYPRSEPIPRFAILDLTAPQLAMILDAVALFLDDTDPADHETAAELTAILQQAREALA
ncbi:hypothetical protein ACN9JG_06130 [Cereibacter azotoformans]|uniref:hypothetical protein n=1 Tax=Cereibacter azotoformans TaxID=43057 RepID=UPI003B219233